MSALRVLVGGFDQPSATVRHLAQVAPLVVIGARMANELEAELGSAQAVALFLYALATERQMPVGIHTGSRTVFISPSSWSSERLAGFVAGHFTELAQEYGAIERMTSSTATGAA